MTDIKIPKRISNALINSLTAGVVPRIGLEYINVGRKNEIKAFLKDIEDTANDSAAFRFIVGKYGSGKSFMLQLIRSFAMEKGFVVVDGDLSPERRFTGSKGQGLATYRELIQNMSTKTKPDGGALNLIIEKWLSSLKMQIASENSGDVSLIDDKLKAMVFEVVNSMEDMVHGFDFAKILSIYLDGYINSDSDKKSAALKWLRGEFSTKTEAKSALGVSVIISDDNWYEYLKLMSSFVKRAGYKGLIVIIDELVNLFKIPQGITRQNNYEKILTIFNDTMQGKAKSIAFFMGGTPQFIDDTRKGLFSYEALKSRLQKSRFIDDKFSDMLSPIIRLNPLSNEEILVLCENIANVHSKNYDYVCSLTKESFITFMNAELSRIGSNDFITPREITRDLIEILNILYQNQNLCLEDILNENFKFAKPELEGEKIDETFAEFEL